MDYSYYYGAMHTESCIIAYSEAMIQRHGALMNNIKLCDPRPKYPSAREAASAAGAGVEQAESWTYGGAAAAALDCPCYNDWKIEIVVIA